MKKSNGERYESDRRWREQNAERIKIMDRESARRRRAANPKYSREKYRKWWATLTPDSPARQRMRDREMRRRYGIDAAGLMAMLKAQGGKCPICECALSARGRGTHIDHDHNNGKVRGALCRKCNAALGFFDDRAELLLKAYDYLHADQDIKVVA